MEFWAMNSAFDSKAQRSIDEVRSAAAEEPISRDFGGHSRWFTGKLANFVLVVVVEMSGGFRVQDQVQTMKDRLDTCSP